jgi:hypothetical protein
MAFFPASGTAFRRHRRAVRHQCPLPFRASQLAIKRPSRIIAADGMLDITRQFSTFTDSLGRFAEDWPGGRETRPLPGVSGMTKTR